MHKKLVLTGLLAAVLTAVPAFAIPDSAPAQSASAACRKAPTWTDKGATRFGIALGGRSGWSIGDDLKREEKRFGVRIPVVRVWDGRMPKENAWTQRKEWFGTRWVNASISLRPQEVIAGKHDAKLRNYFSRMTTAAPIFYNFIHEPEDDIQRGKYTAAQYREAFRRVINIASSLCRSNLYPTLVLMGWTARPESGRNWKDYYPGSDYISLLAWDTYNYAQGRARSYLTPDEIYGDLKAKSAAAGKPWAMAETGSVRISGDHHGAGRANWLKKIAPWFQKNNAVYVTYFQSTNDNDYELRDTPGIKAWKGIMG